MIAELARAVLELVRTALVNLFAAVLMMAGLWFLLLPSPRRTA